MYVRKCECVRVRVCVCAYVRVCLSARAKETQRAHSNRLTDTPTRRRTAKMYTAHRLCVCNMCVYIYMPRVLHILVDVRVRVRVPSFDPNVLISLILII